MTLGGEMHFRTLVEYLMHFADRFAMPVTASGPPGTGWLVCQGRLGAGAGGEGPATAGLLVQRARLPVSARYQSLALC